MFWPKFKKWLKSFKFVSKVLLFFKLPIPYLSTVSTAIAAIIMLGDKIKDVVIKNTQKKSDEVIKQASEAEIKIEEEVKKPLPQQDNDVLRQAARERHNGK